MKIKLVPGYSMPCTTHIFEIQGIPARLEDFGQVYDDDPDNAEPYCCEAVHFHKSLSDTRENLCNKYHIDDDELDVVLHLLEVEFNVGSCEWCE